MIAVIITPLFPALAREPVENAGSEGLPKVPAGLNCGETLEIKPAWRVTAIYTYKVFAPRMEAVEWTLFTPRPSNSNGQKILRCESDPSGETIIEQSPLMQSVLRVRSAVKTKEELKSREWKVHIDANLYSRRLVHRKGISMQPVVADINDRDRSLFLRQSIHFDYKSPQVTQWMSDHDFRRHPDEGEIEFGRRLFQFIANNFKYEYLGDQNRFASNVCMVGKSDCGGLSVLFCTVMRAQGIPARTLAGRWASSEKPGEKIGNVFYHQEHVKAEFFAQGVGWVPVDLSSAVLHDPGYEKAAFFGNDPGDFITLHLDNDLIIDTGQFGVKQYALMQRPCYWVSGSGTLENAVESESWIVPLGVKRLNYPD